MFSLGLSLWRTSFKIMASCTVRASWQATSHQHGSQSTGTPRRTVGNSRQSIVAVVEVNLLSLSKRIKCGHKLPVWDFSLLWPAYPPLTANSIVLLTVTVGISFMQKWTLLWLLHTHLTVLWAFANAAEWRWRRETLRELTWLRTIFLGNCLPFLQICTVAMHTWLRPFHFTVLTYSVITFVIALMINQ